MTNLIRENSFELQLEGMNIKFTTLHERFDLFFKTKTKKLDGMNIKFTTLHERFDLFSSKRLLVRVSLDSFTNY